MIVLIEIQSNYFFFRVFFFFFKAAISIATVSFSFVIENLYLSYFRCTRRYKFWDKNYLVELDERKFHQFNPTLALGAGPLLEQ